MKGPIITTLTFGSLLLGPTPGAVADHSCEVPLNEGICLGFVVNGLVPAIPVGDPGTLSGGHIGVYGVYLPDQSRSSIGVGEDPCAMYTSVFEVRCQLGGLLGFIGEDIGETAFPDPRICLGAGEFYLVDTWDPHNNDPEDLGPGLWPEEPIWDPERGAAFCRAGDPF